MESQFNQTDDCTVAQYFGLLVFAVSVELAVNLDHTVQVILKVSCLSQIAESTDYLPVLVPMSERFMRIVEENRERLEPVFIITSKDNVWNSAPFAALMKGERT